MYLFPGILNISHHRIFVPIKRRLQMFLRDNKSFCFILTRLGLLLSAAFREMLSCRLGLRLCLKWFLARNKPAISHPVRSALDWISRLAMISLPSGRCWGCTTSWPMKTTPCVGCRAAREEHMDWAAAGSIIVTMASVINVYTIIRKKSHSQAPDLLIFC